MSDMPDKIWLWGGGFATDASYTTNPKAVQQEVDTEYTRTDLAQATIEKLGKRLSEARRLKGVVFRRNEKQAATIEKLEEDLESCRSDFTTQQYRRNKYRATIERLEGDVRELNTEYRKATGEYWFPVSIADSKGDRS